MKFKSPEHERWFYDQLYQVDEHFTTETETEGKVARKYAATIIKYAERLADLIERRMAETGKPLEEVAYDATYDADWDDDRAITLFMYGVACDMLNRVWIYADAFREWHNRRWHFGPEPVPKDKMVRVGMLKTPIGDAAVIATYADTQGKTVQQLMDMVRRAVPMPEA